MRDEVAKMNGGERIRTDDPLLAKQVLYQLSYAPVGPKPNSQRVARQCSTGRAKLVVNRVAANSGDCFQHRGAMLKAMGQGGLEPPTPRLSSVCSNQLSY